MTWLSSRSGRPIELVAPVAAEVDWADLAHAMSHLNRYGGHAQTPVSIGLHTLIAAEAAPFAVKPYVLLHDAHETRTGEIPAPTKAALRLLAAEALGEEAARHLDEIREHLEGLHDRAFHEAAGLAMPSAAEKALVKQADLVALATERRDFLAPAAASREWEIDRMGIRPSPRVVRWRAPGRVADELLRAFHAWLPALSGRAIRTAA